MVWHSFQLKNAADFRRIFIVPQQSERSLEFGTRPNYIQSDRKSMLFHCLHSPLIFMASFAYCRLMVWYGRMLRRAAKGRCQENGNIILENSPDMRRDGGKTQRSAGIRWVAAMSRGSVRRNTRRRPFSSRMTVWGVGVSPGFPRTKRLDV